MTYELSVLERVVILAILPRQGDITKLRIVRDLERELSFSEEEHKALKLRSLPDGRIKWDGAATKTIEMGDVALGLIRDRLKELSDSDQLQMDHLPIYERFVEGKVGDGGTSCKAEGA